MAQIKIDEIDAKMWLGLAVEQRQVVEADEGITIPGLKEAYLVKMNAFIKKLAKAANPGEMSGSGTLRKGGGETGGES